LRVAVFVDGCFWHLCPQHGRIPGGKNAAYWKKKLVGNRDRDKLNTRALRGADWIVVRIWEHTPVDEAVSKICSAVKIARRRVRLPVD
jgi:DNA mismatch endonuclease (patch repair protein)